MKTVQDKRGAIAAALALAGLEIVRDEAGVAHIRQIANRRGARLVRAARMPSPARAPDLEMNPEP